MKAEITENGELIISAENGLESFALRKWSGEQGEIESVKIGALIISWNLSQKEDTK